MKFSSTKIEGVIVIVHEPHCDDRGLFERRFCARELTGVGISFTIAQINRSLTKTKGTIRGLHYQAAPMSECKIVQCIRGAIFDVAVDLREKSETFLKWHGEVLDAVKGTALVIPPGCAHGFQSLVDDTEILYFVDHYYSPEHERTVNFADPGIGIAWPLSPGVVSVKDRAASFIQVSHNRCFQSSGLRSPM